MDINSIWNNELTSKKNKYSAKTPKDSPSHNPQLLRNHIKNSEIDFSKKKLNRARTARIMDMLDFKTVIFIPHRTPIPYPTQTFHQRQYLGSKPAPIFRIIETKINHQNTSTKIKK
jgi:hypothetical protein